MTDNARPGQVPAADVPADAFLVDVREPDEWTAGHAPGAMHIPLGQLGARYTEIPQEGQVFVICRAGDLGAKHSAVQEIADTHGVSPQQVTLAWMLALAPVVVPIPGASRPASITDSAQAADLVLTDDEVTRLSRG